MSSKPIIAITMGDPAGIGPEIIAKSLSNQEIYNFCQPLVIGDSRVMQQALTFCRLSSITINCISEVTSRKNKFGFVDVIDLQNIVIDQLKLGKVQAACGKAVYEYIAKATTLALTNQVDAIATAPINKESLKAAQINYIGHTEIFAGLCKIPNPLTIFVTKGLHTFFLSRHLSLRQACDYVTKNKLLSCIIQCREALQHLNLNFGPLAVAGLNPHCGEKGLFGDEEITAITPAILEAQKLGHNVIGPIAADSIFHLAQKNKYAGILALYHDQGHIGMKTIDFERTISLTYGLPFIRTSVDHGTAFDVAGKGTASDISMQEAIYAALRYF